MDITKLAQFKSNKSPVKFTIKQNFFMSSYTILLLNLRKDSNGASSGEKSINKNAQWSSVVFFGKIHQVFTVPQA